MYGMEKCLLFALQFNSLSVINSHWDCGFQRHKFKYHESKFALTIHRLTKYCVRNTFLAGVTYSIYVYIHLYMPVPHIVMCVTKSKSKTKAENIVDTHSYVRDAYVFIVIRCGSAWQIRSEIFSLLGES